jgi:penicillin-insensitive murein endopeptidase
MGTAADGNLVCEAIMPVEGDFHAVLANCVPRSTNFGTQEIVELLLYAGAQVSASLPGPRLMLGNIAKQGGGNIPWSHSHNSGRDADLAFYVLDKNGNPVDAPSLLSFGANLKAGDYTLDVPRNWALVKAILTHPTIQAQWLFAATWIKQALIEYAEAQGEDPALIEKARQVVWQPTDSAPHNDHLHLRIYCSLQDRLEGCINGAPIWSWVDTYNDAFATRSERLCEGLHDPALDVRLDVLAFMDKIQARPASPCLAEHALTDPQEEVREQATALLMRWQPDDPRVYDAIERLIRAPGGGVLEDDPAFTRQDLPPRPERDASTLKRAYDILAALGDSQAVPMLTRALQSKRVFGRDGEAPNDPARTVEAALAARALQHVMDLRLVPDLIDALVHPSPQVRQAAARTLARVTNHGLKGPPNDSPKELAAHQRRWRGWWEDQQGRSRDALLLEGFRDAKLKLKALDDPKGYDALIKATKRDDHVGYNAHLVLARNLHRFYSPSLSPEQRHAQWSKWWRKNKKRFGGGKR